MLCIIVYSTTRWPCRWSTFCTVVVVVVAVMDLAVIVCGHHGLAVIVFHVAVMVCGRHSRSPRS